MKKLFSLTWLLLVAVCCGQGKSLDKEPLNLQTFDFGRSFSSIFPETLRNKEYPTYFVYDIPVENERMPSSFQKDSVYTDEFSEDKKFFGFQTNQMGYNSRHHFAYFGNVKFNKIGLFSAPKGQTEVISAMAYDLTKEEVADYITALKNKLGPSKKLTSNHHSNSNHMGWKKEGKVYRLSTSWNDESNTLNMEIDQQNKTISQGRINPHYDLYFFVAKPPMRKGLMEMMNTGDFTFFPAKKDFR